MDDSIKTLMTFFLGAVTGASWRWLFKTIKNTWRTDIEVETRLTIAVPGAPTETRIRELSVWAAILNEYFSEHK